MFKMHFAFSKTKTNCAFKADFHGLIRQKFQAVLKHVDYVEEGRGLSLLLIMWLGEIKLTWWEFDMKKH